MKFAIPLRTKSAANLREHWRKKAARVKNERFAAYGFMRANLNGHAWPPDVQKLNVTLTRVAPRELDGDNLQSALKAARDGIADALGVNDRDPRVAWLYEQRRGAVREYSVLVSVEAR